MSNRLARKHLVEGRCSAGTVTRSRSKLRSRGQGPELQQPLGETFTAIWVGNQHHLAAVGLHGQAALIDVELFVDQHYRGQVVASRQLRHQPMHPGLSAKARRAGRHLGNVEDTRRSGLIEPGSGSPGTNGGVAAAKRWVRTNQENVEPINLVRQFNPASFEELENSWQLLISALSAEVCPF